MTSQELQDKYNQAQEKVEKRIATTLKFAKKEGIDGNKLMNAYRSFVANYNDTYLRHKNAEAIVSQFKSISDLSDTSVIDSLTKLYDLEKVASNWKVKLDTQVNKESMPKIKAIWDFLNNWEISAREWYKEESQRLVDSYNKFYKIAQDFLKDKEVPSRQYSQEYKDLQQEFDKFFEENYRVKSRFHFSKWGIDVEDWIVKQDFNELVKELTSIRTIQPENSSFMNPLEMLKAGVKAELVNFDEEKLNKILAQEKLNKYIDLCDRISDVVGEITDVSNLSVGHKFGELNGIVEGTKGKAKIETIGAGGYNQDTIVNSRHGQVFHYRILVNKLKG